MIKVCINCNAKNLEEALFCKKCGTKLPTLKEIENSLREEQEDADRKWKEEVEKARESNEALNKERRNEGSVTIYDKKESKVAVASRTSLVSKARTTPPTSSARMSKPKEETKSNGKLIIVLSLILVSLIGGFFGFKYLSDQGITIATITDKIKEQQSKFTSSKDKVNTINKGRSLGTFIDSKTGLVWQDDEDAKSVIRDWKEAEGYCNNLTLADKNDWRLPLKFELESIIDTDNIPAIKDGFQNVSSTHYWGSPIKIGSTFAWHIYFGEDGGSYYETMDNLNSVRCVREN